MDSFYVWELPLFSFYFRVNNINITIFISKNIARNYVPNGIIIIGIMSNDIFSVEPKSSHIGIDGYLRSWTRCLH